MAWRPHEKDTKTLWIERTCMPLRHVGLQQGGETEGGIRARRPSGIAASVSSHSTSRTAPPAPYSPLLLALDRRQQARVAVHVAAGAARHGLPIAATHDL